jgi:hypothetical protein
VNFASPSINERLEKLTERHEALAESVELLSQSIHGQGANIDKLRVNIDKLIANSGQDAENIRALARIPELNQTRIEKLEERQN